MVIFLQIYVIVGNIPVIYGNFSVIVGNIYVIVGNIPVIVGNIPVIYGNFSVIVGNIYVIVGNIPVIVGNIPVIYGNFSVIVGNIYVIVGNIPVIVGNIPVIFGNIPVIVGEFYWQLHIIILPIVGRSFTNTLWQKKHGNCHLWMAWFDEHSICPHCRIAAVTCNLDDNNPCRICRSRDVESRDVEETLWIVVRRLNKEGKTHWSDAFLFLQDWLDSRPISSRTSTGLVNLRDGLVLGLYSAFLAPKVALLCMTCLLKGTSESNGTCQ